ncbi:MAG TPA: hypothetical protein VGE50_05165 [Gammaproteobacteria bacterium]
MIRHKALAFLSGFVLLCANALVSAKAVSPADECYGKDAALDPPGYKALAEQIWSENDRIEQGKTLDIEEERIVAAKTLLLLHEHQADLKALLLAKQTGRARLEEFLIRLDPLSEYTDAAKSAVARVGDESQVVQKLIDGLTHLDTNAVKSQASREKAPDDYDGDDVEVWIGLMVGSEAAQGFWIIMQKPENLNPDWDPPGYMALVAQIKSDYERVLDNTLDYHERRALAAKALLLLREQRAELEAALHAKQTYRTGFAARHDLHSYNDEFELARLDHEIATLGELIFRLGYLDMAALRYQPPRVKDTGYDKYEYLDDWVDRMLGKDAAHSFFMFIHQDRALDPYLSWFGAGMDVGLLSKYDPGHQHIREVLEERCDNPSRIPWEIVRFSYKDLGNVWKRLLKGLEPDRVIDLSTKLYKIEQRTELTRFNRLKRSSLSYDAAAKTITYLNVEFVDVQLRIPINLPDAGFPPTRYEMTAPIEEWNTVRGALGLPPEAK